MSDSDLPADPNDPEDFDASETTINDALELRRKKSKRRKLATLPPRLATLPERLAKLPPKRKD